jgi:hypothetical protein
MREKTKKNVGEKKENKQKKREKIAKKKSKQKKKKTREEAIVHSPHVLEYLLITHAQLGVLQM